MEAAARALEAVARAVGGARVQGASGKAAGAGWEVRWAKGLAVDLVTEPLGWEETVEESSAAEVKMEKVTKGLGGAEGEVEGHTAAGAAAGMVEALWAEGGTVGVAAAEVVAEEETRDAAAAELSV